MAFELEKLTDLAAASFDEIIDVRSPGEFEADHIPGAVNLPVLDNAERARVGTIYKQESAFLARKIGAALVARNVAGHIEAHFRDKTGGYRPLIYCWRGGMRSGAMATILGQIGWRAETLAGGYKTYRNAVVRTLYEPAGGTDSWSGRLIVLDGNTGTAKTEILQKLFKHGVQVLDLEGLAGHRGSLFGGLETVQPTQRTFDSAVAWRWTGFDLARPILVEAELSRIGTLSLPKVLWAEMRRAPRIRIEAGLDARAHYLAQTYADIGRDTVRLCDTIRKLSNYHAAATIETWQTLAACNDLPSLARELIEHHYDPKYARQRARSAQLELATIQLSGFDALQIDAAVQQITAVISASAPVV